jgi:hypothetical protein
MIAMDATEEQEVAAPGQRDEYDDELVDEIVKNLSLGRRHISEWRVEAREAYDFFAGNQWDEADAAKLSDENRPAVVFNRIARTINAVSGLEVQNRQEVRYFPRHNSSDIQGQINQPKLAELLTDASKWVREQCDAEDEESEGFQDSLICGIGTTETRMDYEDNPEGKIIVERFDPLEFLYDPSSKKRNFQDARWVARIKEMTRKEFNAMWPDHEEINAGTFWNDNEATPHDADNDWKYENDQGDKLNKSNTVSVIQYQYYEKEIIFKVASPTDGKLVELPADRFGVLLEKKLVNKNLPYVKFPKRVYKECFVVGKTILEQREIGCNHFTLRAITGLRDRNRNYWFGLVSLMKDPQRWANKWLSQIQHILNTDAKNGLYAERGAISNTKKFEEDHAKPGSISYVNDGALTQGKIQPKTPARYPEGLDRLLQYALQSINDVPGVNLELIGLAERDQPFVLEQTRKQAGITILATFFDALRRYRKEQGRVLAYYIREYISDGRLIRVVGPTGMQYIPLMKDALSFEYDIVVDDAPTSPNVKERSFGVLSQFLPMALQSGIPVPPDILDYAPLPEDLVQKWKKLITDSQNNPEKQQLDMINNMLAQLELQKKQSDIQKTQSDITLNYAKAEQAHAIGQDETAQAQQKMGMQHQMDYEKMMREQSRKDLEMMLTMRRKELEGKMQANIKAKQQTAVPFVH